MVITILIFDLVWFISPRVVDILVLWDVVYKSYVSVYLKLPWLIFIFLLDIC